MQLSGATASPSAFARSTACSCARRSSTLRSRTRSTRFSNTRAARGSSASSATESLALLTAPILNEYVSEHLGDDFTTKDFRTWGGTLTAAVALAEHGPPASPGEERKVLAAVMRRVGDELGNTASVARSAYVSPAVVEQWRAGRTLEGVSPRSQGGRVRRRRDEGAPARGEGPAHAPSLVADPARARAA